MDAGQTSTKWRTPSRTSKFYYEHLSNNRYLGLSGNHIVPAILYSYNQEPQRPDLLHKEDRQLISKVLFLDVWTRFEDRLKTVVADTYMVTITESFPSMRHTF